MDQLQFGYITAQGKIVKKKSGGAICPDRGSSSFLRKWAVASGQWAVWSVTAAAAGNDGPHFHLLGRRNPP